MNLLLAVTLLPGDGKPPEALPPTYETARRTPPRRTRVIVELAARAPAPCVLAFVSS